MWGEGEFGGISEDELKAFMADYPGFDDAGIGITARFARSVGKLVFTRSAKQEVAGIAVFLLSDSLAADQSSAATKPFPLLANGNDAIVGSVWLVQAELKNAIALDVAPVDANTAGVTVALAGFSARAAVVVDARSQPWQARLYPMGFAESEVWLSMDLADGPISETVLKDALDRFWTQCVRTPTQANQMPHQLWKDSSTGVPMPRPEQRVQSRLRDTLVGAFPRRRVRAEVRTDEGRGDIFILADTTSIVGSPAQSTDWVLELKALCDMTSTGHKIPDQENRSRDAVQKGLIQAIAYRTDQNGVQAALCCYEMRKTDEDDATFFQHVKSPAASNAIRLWRWSVFRSDHDARSSRFATAFAEREVSH